jgi:hypothetical protein
MTYADFKAAVLKAGGTVDANMTEDGYRVVAVVDSTRFVFEVESNVGLAATEHPKFDRYMRTIRDMLRGHGVPFITDEERDVLTRFEREDPDVDYAEVD